MEQGQEKIERKPELARNLRDIDRENESEKKPEKKKKPSEIRENILKSARLTVKLYKLCAEFIWWALQFIGWEQLMSGDKKVGNYKVYLFL